MKPTTLRLVRQRLPIPGDVRALTPVLLRWAYSAPLVAYFIYCALLNCQLQGLLPQQWQVSYALLAGDGVSMCFFVAALAYIRVLAQVQMTFFLSIVLVTDCLVLDSPTLHSFSYMAFRGSART